MQIDHFSSKSVLLSKKVCCKVSLCENFQRPIYSRPQMVGGGCLLLREIFDQSDPAPSKTTLSNLYSFVARQLQNLEI